MPEPLRYLGALSAALLVSAACAWILFKGFRSATRFAPVMGIILGAATGIGVLQLKFTLPPASALDRFLLILLPITAAVEAIACLPRLPAWIATVSRIAIVLATSRILLHGSVHLNTDVGSSQAVALLVISTLLLATVWFLLDRLQARSRSPALPLSLALTLLCGGMVIMLAGYLKGGSLSFTLAGAIFGAAAVAMVQKRGADQPPADLRGTAALGTVALVGLLMMGRFFGRISTSTAIVLLMAPLLGWCVELPLLRRQPRWQRDLLQLALVITLLAIVFLLAKQHFDQFMRPLM